ncbi:MAG TPA: hypothetical protein VH518_12440 [Tepidisphaeraceae bacterium]|jgi:hypothetical protein
MSRKHVALFTLTLVTLLAPLTGCSNTTCIQVAVPPRVDLAGYHTLGIVTFKASNGDPDLERLATQRFLAAVQAAQPGTRVVELGSEPQALDFAGLQAIRKERGLDAIFTGRVDVTKAKPSVSVASLWSSGVNVRADVDAALSARLLEAGSGATAWTNSAKRTENVANASFSQQWGQKSIGFGGKDTNSAYENMVNCLVNDITDDFRTHFVTRRVPKDQVVVQTASAGG